MNNYKAYIRPALRQLVANSMPGPLWARKHIAVAGLPRSGTSWLAKAISLSAPQASYYFEPDHQLGKAYWYKFVPPDEQDPVLQSHIRSSLNGGIRDEYTIAEQGWKEIVLNSLSHTVLVKWVRLSLSLDWVARHFPDLTVIQTIRHPVPLILSWQQRDWEPDYNIQLLLGQPNLMAGPLQPYAELMGQAETYWEKAGAFWGAVSYLQWQSHRPNWVLLEHEWYCLDPATRIKWLIERLGLTWNNRIDEFLSPDRARVSGPGYGAARDPRKEVDKWKSKISPGQLRELESVIKQFSLPFYPNLEPEAFWDPSLNNHNNDNNTQ